MLLNDNNHQGGIINRIKHKLKQLLDSNIGAFWSSIAILIIIQHGVSY